MNKINLKDIPTPQLIGMRDALTVGIVATSSVKEAANGGSIVEQAELERKLAETEASLAKAQEDKKASDEKVAELTEKLTKLAELETELASIKTEIEPLRAFKVAADEAKAKAEKLEALKEKITKAGLDVSILSSKEDYWLAKSEADVDETIALLVESKKVEPAKASVQSTQVPPINGNTINDSKAVVAEALNELKKRK